MFGWFKKKEEPQKSPTFEDLDAFEQKIYKYVMGIRIQDASAIGSSLFCDRLCFHVYKGKRTASITMSQLCGDYRHSFSRLLVKLTLKKIEDYTDYLLKEKAREELKKFEDIFESKGIK